MLRFYSDNIRNHVPVVVLNEERQKSGIEGRV